MATGIVPRQEYSEPLLITRRICLSKYSDDFRIGEPFGDGESETETTPQFSTADIEGGSGGEELILGQVLVSFRAVGDHLERNHYNTKLLLMLSNQRLRVIRAVEVLVVAIFARTRVVSTNNKVGTSVILANNRMP